MEIDKKEVITVSFTKDDLKRILSKELNLEEKDIVVFTETTKTEVIQGYDPHDADYVEVFTGLKIVYERK